MLFVTIWELGEAAGPLFIAPLSEIFGRYPVYNAANVLFIGGIVLSALSQDVNLLVFSRFLTGCAVATNVLNPAIVGDMYPSDSRGSPMSIVMLAPLIGGAVGPSSKRSRISDFNVADMRHSCRRTCTSHELAGYHVACSRTCVCL